MNHYPRLINYLLIISSFVLVSCATSTRTTNVLATTSGLVAATAHIESGSSYGGGIPLGPMVKHQINLRGSVLCSASLPYFKSLQVELWERGKIIVVINIDDNGNFLSVLQSQVGSHEVRLVRKKDNQILDKVEFHSDKDNDRFNLNLKGC